MYMASHSQSYIVLMNIHFFSLDTDFDLHFI